MKKGTIPVEDRKLIIPESVYLELEDMAAEKRKKADEFVKPLITPLSMAQKILLVVTTREKNKRKQEQHQ